MALISCPECGHNSAVSAFEESMDSVEKMLASLSEMKQMLTDSYGRDKAETMCRGLLESSIGDIVSAFQKFAACHYDKLTGKKSRVNDFQIVEKGSLLFKNAIGKGYEEWLSDKELHDMNMLFQRRHLIEHNNGMVDQKYIDKSGDDSYFSVNFPENYDDSNVYLKDIISEEVGMKFCIALMREVLDKQVENAEEPRIKIMSQVYLPVK